MNAEPSDPRLDGRTIVIARSEERAEGLRLALEALGATVLVLPVTRHRPLPLDGEGRRAIEERLTYSHAAFASQNAVQFFFEACRRLGVDAGAWRGVRIAAVGPRTAQELESVGLRAHVIADGGAAALARKLLDEEGPARLKRILLPQSAIARPELRAALERAHVPVVPLPVYTTLTEEPDRIAHPLELLWSARSIDSVYFASPSGVDAFLSLTGDRGKELLTRSRVRILAIGSTTAHALANRGLGPVVETGTTDPALAARRIASALS